MFKDLGRNRALTPFIEMRWCLLFLAWLAAMAQAADPVLLESLVAPLLKARTYCESGKWGASISPADPLSSNTYRVCAHEDGRFKYVQDPGLPQQITRWSDKRKLHRYVSYGGGYQAYDLASLDAGSEYGKTREPVPSMHSRLFRAATRTGAGLDLPGSLRDYQVNPQLSDHRQTTYERFDSDRRGGSRIRVNAADGSIVRFESLYGGVVREFVEVSAREVDRTLTEADLAHEVPLTARFSPQNNVAGFFALLFAATALAGLAYWSIRFARNRGIEDFADTRPRLWRYFAMALGSVAGVLALLAALTWGGSGHPPAIVFVAVLAVWAAIGFGLVACLLLVSYPAEALVRRSRRQ
jgi:hypothetical protein